MNLPPLGYSCHGCGSFFERWPGPKCPTCSAFKMNVGAPPEDTANEETARPLGENVLPLEKRSTGLAFLDDVLDRGVVQGHLILLTGQPGAGKTTLSLQLLAQSRGDQGRPPLYLCSEQPEEDLVSLCKRLGFESRTILYSSTTNLARIETLLLETRPRDAVIDSINCLVDPAAERSAGSPRMLEEAAHRLFALAHAVKVTIWCIAHTTTKGRMRGPMTAAHWCDVLMGLWLCSPKDPTSSRLLGYVPPYKNRGGKTCDPIVLRMTERGLWPDDQTDV